MKDYEAIKLGFSYTGMSTSAYDKVKWEKYKKEAQEIKKLYKGADFRIVEKRCQTRYGSELYKSIYGNDIFCKVQYFNPEQELKNINENIPAMIEKIKAETEKKIQELLEEQKEKLEKYNYLMSLRK